MAERPHNLEGNFRNWDFCQIQWGFQVFSYLQYSCESQLSSDQCWKCSTQMSQTLCKVRAVGGDVGAHVHLMFHHVSPCFTVACQTKSQSVNPLNPRCCNHEESLMLLHSSRDIIQIAWQQNRKSHSRENPLEQRKKTEKENKKKTL